MNNFKSIDINKLKDIDKKINLIDIREPYEYNSGHLKNSINIPMEELLEAPDEFLNEDETYYIVCRASRRSVVACMQLSDEGYNVINVSSGIVNYKGNLV